MLKFLKGVVAGSGTGVKDLPYNIGEPYSCAWGSWVHYRGTSKVISSSGSFIFYPRRAYEFSQSVHTAWDCLLGFDYGVVAASSCIRFIFSLYERFSGFAYVQLDAACGVQ